MNHRGIPSEDLAETQIDSGKNKKWQHLYFQYVQLLLAGNLVDALWNELELESELEWSLMHQLMTLGSSQ